MTTRAQGRKKSYFVAKTTVEAGGYLDYVVNGTNYKISYDNFVSNLGVTGSIVQDGAVTGAAILDTQGTVNNIRNLENGSGITANVSPENGVILAHSFTQDATGTPIFLNTTADSPTFASLVAGNGIALTSTDNYVTIAQEGIAEYANVHMHGNSTETVIASTATAVKVAGTFIVGDEAGYTGDTTGRITHDGNTARHIINAIISMTVASGTNHKVSMYIALNGTVIPSTKTTTTTSNGLYRSLATFANLELDEGDYVEIFVRNESTTDNLIVLDAIIGAL
jgi:hypothetical protein